MPNPASVALHESLGFELVGIYRRIGYKHGAWRDVGWWQLGPRRPDRVPPAEPRPPGGASPARASALVEQQRERRAGVGRAARERQQLARHLVRR